MKIFAGLPAVLVSIGLLSFANAQDEAGNGFAPEVTALNAKDVSWAQEAKLPDLEKPYVSARPEDKKDGLVVGQLGVDGGDANAVLQFAQDLSAPPTTVAGRNGEKTVGAVDSLLVSYRGKLLLEAYYRRGRANYPHYQMSITKSYTALALGRAIQLGHLKMEDLDKPVISFLKELDAAKLAPGADGITLAQAMGMLSGIRVDEAKLKELRRKPAQLQGQGEIQAYLENSAPIPPPPREFKYQETDPAMAMQVLNAVVPGGAENFIRDELLKPLGITNYNWEKSVSGLPKSAAGAGMLSRDMLKIGQLIMNKGKWQGQQLIPEDYIVRATTPSAVNKRYGLFWWIDDFDVGGKTYHSFQGRGAGGQFIFMVPELDLIAVVTSHDQGMGNMLETLPQKLIPAFLAASQANAK